MAWHQQDPVDAAEIQRNAVVVNQGKPSNDFVVDPHRADVVPASFVPASERQRAECASPASVHSIIGEFVARFVAVSRGSEVMLAFLSSMPAV